VWGSNANSELGLSDEQVTQNITSYVKYSMKKVLRQTAFGDEAVVQVACGNASSVMLVIDPETRYQTIVYAGLTTITKDEKN
jgi:alpha-tubulin suppressor-like RCC1 family protein